MGDEQLVGMVMGICILLYVIHLLTKKKFLGNLGSNITQMVLDLFFGILKGTWKSLKKFLFH